MIDQTRGCEKWVTGMSPAAPDTWLVVQSTKTGARGPFRRWAMPVVAWASVRSDSGDSDTEGRQLYNDNIEPVILFEGTPMILHWYLMEEPPDETWDTLGFCLGKIDTWQYSHRSDLEFKEPRSDR